MKLKTSEAKDRVLNYLVSKCEGRGIEFEDPRDPWLTRDGISDQPLHSYNPSTDWAQGGPIIEREKVCVAWLSKQDLGMEPEHYCVAHIDGIYCYYGPTPLIAAMRCYVASKLGDEVEVPDDLK